MSVDIKTIIDFVLLFILLISAIWIFFMISGYGGSVGRSLKIIGWGSIIMALSHLLEVSVAHLSIHNVYAFMFLHRFFATAGFVIIAFGFKTLVKK